MPSYALLLSLPIICLSSLNMHPGHFILSTSLPANSALLWQSLHCTVLAMPCLSLYLGVSAISAQRSDTGLSTVTFQEQLFPRPTDNDPSLVCYLLQKQTVLPYLCIFTIWFLERFHGTANSISWHFGMKQMLPLDVDFPSQKCHQLRMRFHRISLSAF